ncbi:unnamed protein product [Brassica rapa]|uniref:Uncharacterized protein n=2 Tax=Brassica TaxID=3705 RepID=A0A8D9G3R1_BRACM|nr:unnamed protein product [Brassica napus]CAG7867988.1 unnamed protein product [Brassica rapa]
MGCADEKDLMEEEDTEMEWNQRSHLVIGEKGLSGLKLTGNSLLRLFINRKLALEIVQVKNMFNHHNNPKD